jgi:hypothetical protein
MDTTQTTPQSDSSAKRMDVDSPPNTVTYHHRCTDDIPRYELLPTEVMDRSPGSEIPIYTPAKTTTLPPPHIDFTRAPLRPSDVPVNLQPRSTSPPLHTAPQIQPAHPVIRPVSNITVIVGEENAVFQRVCDTLDNALVEWKERVTDHDKDHNPSMDVIILNIPSDLSERIIYGKRTGEQRYWEGDLNLWPGHTRVVKLRPKVGQPSFYGVWIGIIDDFWNCSDGVHVFYGMDKKIYCHPGSSWGFLDGEWEVVPVEGGWDPRGFSSETEIDHFQFRPRGI